MDNQFAICIGRQPGSGGRIIGEKLASKLQFSFYDKEIILLASKESGVGKEYFEKIDEKTGHSIFGGLFGMRSSMMGQVYADYFLSNESLFKIQSDVIREMANKNSSVFVGRCADYVLSDSPNCLSIFITADIDDRIKRIAQLQNIDAKKAEALIEKMDKKRAEYYNYFSNKEWGVAQSYHLCVNSSVLGIDSTIELILNFVKKRFGI